MIETNSDIASLICYTSLTLVAIFVAVLGFFQSQYSTLSYIKALLNKNEIDIDVGKKHYNISRNLDYIESFSKMIKFFIFSFLFIFLLSFIWLLMIEVTCFNNFLIWYPRFVILLFFLICIPLIYAVSKIKIGERSDKE